MKKLLLLTMVAALVVPAMAAETTWSETQNGVIGTYNIWIFEFDVDASITMEVSYADNSPIGNVDYFASTWYSDSDGEIAHLFLDTNKDINVTMSWSGLPALLPRFGVDFLAWDGEGTGDQLDAIYTWENYHTDSGSKMFTVNYDGEDLFILNDGQWWTTSNFTVANPFFDIFGQANNTQGDKLGIGARLDFSPATAPVIPAPGAILLAGLGTSVVGWLRRRRAL